MTGETFPIAVLLGSFFIMIMIRFPIAYAVALSSVPLPHPVKGFWCPPATTW